MNGKTNRKPRCKVFIRENRAGENNELNGYYISFVNKGRRCDSWWSNPGDSFGDIGYLQNRGYHNVQTDKDFKLFSMIVKVALADIKKLDKRFAFYNPSTKMWVKYIQVYHNNVLSDSGLYVGFTPRAVMTAVNDNLVDMNIWEIKEV